MTGHCLTESLSWQREVLDMHKYVCQTCFVTAECDLIDAIAITPTRTLEAMLVSAAGS